MTNTERALLLRDLQAEQPDPGWRSKVNDEYLLGYAARPMKKPFDQGRTPDWRRGWLDGDEHMEKCDEAEQALKGSLQQLDNVGYEAPPIIARTLAFFEQGRLDNDRIDQIRHYMEEEEAVAPKPALILVPGGSVTGRIQ
jgi:hypothetical protein